MKRGIEFDLATETALINEVKTEVKSDVETDVKTEKRSSVVPLQTLGDHLKFDAGLS
jgi:hypothetical protein